MLILQLPPDVFKDILQNHLILHIDHHAFFCSCRMARQLMLPWIGLMEVRLGTKQQSPDGILQCHNGFPRGGTLRKLHISLGQFPDDMTEADLSVLLMRFLMQAEAKERLSLVQHLELSSSKVRNQSLIMILSL